MLLERYIVLGATGVPVKSDGGGKRYVRDVSKRMMISVFYEQNHNRRRREIFFPSYNINLSPGG